MFKKLKVLSEEELEFMLEKDPQGVYLKEVREKFFWIVEKMHQNRDQCSWYERRLLKKFQSMQPGLLIGPKAIIKNPIKAERIMTVEGLVKVQIQVIHWLHVTPSGCIEGDVWAGSVICEGRIEGTVHAENSVEILPGGRILGEVDTPSLQVAEGAFFDGRCLMQKNPVPAGHIE